MATLAAIAALTDAKARGAAYVQFIDAAVARSDAAALKGAIDALVDETVPLSLSRPVLKHAGEAADRIQDNETVEEVCNHGIMRIGGRGAEQFDEADYAFRFTVYKVYIADEDFLRAGSTLAPVRLDGAGFDDATRASTYVKIAQAYVRGADEVAADRFLKRAGEFIHKPGVPPAVVLQFRALYAVLLDSKRRFLEAAQRYIEIVTSSAGAVREEDLVEFLGKAAVCAVLAPAGPARTRVLAVIAREPLLGSIDSAVSGMLLRVFNERIVPDADARAFEGRLQPHQRATTSDGTSVVARALVEHNLLAASRLYASVTFARLGEVLGVPPGAAERTAARMVSEGRLSAALDQVDGMIDFSAAAPAASAAAPSSSAAVSSSAAQPDSVEARLLGWDATIREACARLAEASDAVVTKHPALAPV